MPKNKNKNKECVRPRLYTSFHLTCIVLCCRYQSMGNSRWDPQPCSHLVEPEGENRNLTVTPKTAFILHDDTLNVLDILNYYVMWIVTCVSMVFTSQLSIICFFLSSLQFYRYFQFYSQILLSHLLWVHIVHCLSYATPFVWTAETSLWCNN